MLTGVAEGYWHIRGGPFSSGLLQGALFTLILCNSLFRLCALSDISAYLTRTVETETTRISIGCHSVRTFLVVRWHHIRAIALRQVYFLAVVARGRPGRGRPKWNLLCWYLRVVLLTLLGLCWSYQAICLWDIPQLYRAWMIPPFCPGHILRCVHSQNTDIQALLSPLQWVLKCCRRTLPVLWLRSGNR